METLVVEYENSHFGSYPPVVTHAVVLNGRPCWLVSNYARLVKARRQVHGFVGVPKSPKRSLSPRRRLRAYGLLFHSPLLKALNIAIHRDLLVG